jgi:hypothetical protein
MPMFRRLIFAAASLIVLALGHPALGRPADDFCRTVLENFDAWDADKNGELSAAELDTLSVNRSIIGAPAAAIGALKSFERSPKFELPALTRAYFTGRQTAIAKGEHPSPAFEERFRRTLRRIAGVHRTVYGTSGLTLQTCRQGQLGDCYFVSMIGGLVNRDAEEVKKMITDNNDGTYTVKFAGHDPVVVDQLNDAELALTSTSGNGVWLPILEKAYGQIRNEALPLDRQRAEATDAIARGGSTAPVIRALTAHETDRMSFRTAKDDPEKMEAALKRLRPRLKEAMEKKQIAGVSTPRDGNPPGINGNHAYAVIEFNEAKDTVRLWNPHGNRFHPRGEPGLKNGYVTRSGLFDVPIEDFVRIFGGVVLESDRVAGIARSRAPKAVAPVGEKVEKGEAGR